jgi:hypothetical protein
MHIGTLSFHRQLSTTCQIRWRMGVLPDCHSTVLPASADSYSLVHGAHKSFPQPIFTISRSRKPASRTQYNEPNCCHVIHITPVVSDAYNTRNDRNGVWPGIRTAMTATHSVAPRQAESAPPTTKDTGSRQTKSRQRQARRSRRRSGAAQRGRNRSNRPRARAR